MTVQGHGRAGQAVQRGGDGARREAEGRLGHQVDQRQERLLRGAHHCLRLRGGHLLLRQLCRHLLAQEARPHARAHLQQRAHFPVSFARPLKGL